MIGEISNMKVIDLLNIIAGGKEVPRLIEINNIKYEFNLRSNDIDDLYWSVNDEKSWNNIGKLLNLNDEVKIIEEDNKIEKLNLDTYAKIGTEVDRDLIIKINEIIDKVNKLGD